MFLCIIKEDNNCALTADEQLGGAKKKIFNWFSQFVHICSQVTSDTDCTTTRNSAFPRALLYFPFQLIAGSLSTVKDGAQTDVNLQHNICCIRFSQTVKYLLTNIAEILEPYP